MALAKTTRPRLKGVFPRKRLFRLIDAGRERPVTWLRGPPGAGKTTLIASYLESRKLSSLWYQVDAGDSDVATFFFHLREAAPKRSRPLPLLTPERVPGLAIFTQNFFRELFQRLKAPFVLVLDNYQDAAAEGTFQDVIRLAFGEIPDGGRVIVISRAEPPAAMARLRASRAFHQIGGDDLRLTLEEARGVARTVGGARLTPVQLGSLHKTVDGWTAGLVLLLERGRVERRSVETWLARDPQDVFDYFAEEIFSRQDGQTAEVLLQTAVLPRVTAALAVELTGMPTAGRIIDDLARERYFTNRHGTSEPAYQFHPLFREFLLARGRATMTREWRVKLLKSAAALLDRAEQGEDAVPMLQEAEDWQGLALLVERLAPIVAGQGRTQTVNEWILGLPASLVDTRPWLLYWRGICRMSFNLDEGRDWLVKAYRSFRTERESSGSYLAWTAIVESIIHAYNDFRPLDYWIDQASELTREFPAFLSIDVEARFLTGIIGAQLVRQPQHPDFTGLVARGEEVARLVSHPRLQVPLLFFLVSYHIWTGELDRAWTLAEFLSAIVGQKEALIMDRIVGRGIIGRLQWLMGSPEKAVLAKSESLEIAQNTGVHFLDTLICLDLVIIAISYGEISKAGEQLAKLNPAPMTRAESTTYYMVSGWQAMLVGNRTLAMNYVRQARDALADYGMPSFEAICRFFFAETLRGCGQYDAAREDIATGLQLAKQGRAQLIEYIGHLTDAHREFDLGKETEGLQALTLAMGLGRQHGYVNHFLWNGEMMSRLCAIALAAGIEPDYARELIVKRGLVPDKSSIEIEQWPWPIKIYTLGRFSLLKNDAPMQFSRKAQRKVIHLLKAIIAFGGRSVSEGQLLQVLWPEADGDVAQQALSTTLHRLRRLLGKDETVQRQEGKLTLNPQLCWVDVWALERLLSRVELEGMQNAHGEERSSQVEIWVANATRLHHGAFLGDEDLPWAMPLTDRVQRRLVGALVQLGQRFEQESAWEKAIEWYELAVQASPYSEDSYRRLIHAHQRLGRRAEAVEVYDRCRRNLWAKWGVAPSRETEALYQAIRAE